MTLSFQVLSALHSAWLDKLARGLQSTNKLMPALCYGCLQIKLKNQSFTADFFTGLLSLPVCSQKDGIISADNKISYLRKDQLGAAFE